jgi:L-iditol 2-dehydrogenase
MRAYELVAPRRFALRDVDCPAPGDLAAGEVLVRLRCGAICGSDVPSSSSSVTRTFAIGGVQQAYECAETPARGRLKVALRV